MMRGMLYGETEIHLPIDKSEQISAECNSTLQNLTDKTAILKDGKHWQWINSNNEKLVKDFCYEYGMSWLNM